MGMARGVGGTPVATDIAFAPGALALIAPGAPVGARVFLAALAIVDDMGAVLIIAIFYSQTIAWSALLGAGVIIAILIGFNVIGVCRLWPYLLAGIALWYFVHESGMHATVAGVALAFAIPMRTRINAAEFSRKGRNLLDRFDRTESGDQLVLTSKGQQEALFALEHASKAVTAPILRLEHGLHNFPAFVVMPLFALANAGVRIAGPLEHAESQWEYCSGLWLENRSALRPLHLGRSDWESPNFRAGLDGAPCWVTHAWQGSVLPCRCLSLCLRSMRPGQLTQRRSALLRGRFCQASWAQLF
jgi:Na+/H+ antiporter NhaA